jgi:hypothetical protein
MHEQEILRSRPRSGNGYDHYSSGEREWGSNVAEYVYRDASGRPYLRVVRTSAKQFPQYHWESDHWAQGKPAGPKIPYRLPEMLAALPAEPVFIAEGEKDADNVAELGLIATCNSEGAGKWSDSLNKWFAGRQAAYVIEDNDQAGRDHAARVAVALHGVVPEIRVLSFPELPEHGDVSDWIEQGGTKAQLLERAQKAPAAKPLTATPFRWRDPLKLPPRRWLYGRYYIRKFVSTTIAHSGIGKSSRAIVEALALTTGRTLLGVTPAERCKVWVWNGEDPRDELERRVIAAMQHYGITQADVEGWLFLDNGRERPITIGTQTRNGTVINRPIVENLVAAIQENRIDVLLIDPFVKAHQVNENDNIAIDQVVRQFADIADITNCAVGLEHHSRKTGGAEVTVEAGRGASSQVDAARVVNTLNRMTRDEAAKAGIGEHEAWRYFRSDNGKASMARQPEKADWFKLTSVMLANGDEVGVATAWTWPDPFKGVTVDDLRAAQRAVDVGGPWRSSPRADRWVGKAIAKALGLDSTRHVDRKRIATLLATWTRKGLFVVVEGKDEARRPKQFVEVGQWAESAPTS